MLEQARRLEARHRGFDPILTRVGRFTIPAASATMKGS